MKNMLSHEKLIALFRNYETIIKYELKKLRFI